jgi:hypothetical protein
MIRMLSRRLPFLRMPAWRAGLLHIYCSNPKCGRSLDWAQPEFLAKHPDPVCWTCPPVETPASAVVQAAAEVLQVESAPPVNAAFEVAVAEAEGVDR